MADNIINEIASKHLGKAGDGTVVKPYITPNYVDRTLLVGIPRQLNRDQYNIDGKNLPFYGCDTWNCYEFSTLMPNGFPVSGKLVFSYPSNSPNIVESKSVKLYLNSFNMDTKTNSIYDLERLKSIIQDDIAEYVGVASRQVTVNIYQENGNFYATERYEPLSGTFTLLEEYCDVSVIEFNHYNESPDILEVIQCPKKYPKRYKSYSLRSNCRVTNQPDWGDVFIHIKGEHTVTPESLLQYIISMRKENHFHEEICECIYKRLYDKIQPQELLVACLYTRRGGVDINPVRSSSVELLYDVALPLVNAFNCMKTMRQ